MFPHELLAGIGVHRGGEFKVLAQPVQEPGIALAIRLELPARAAPVRLEREQFGFGDRNAGQYQPCQ